MSKLCLFLSLFLILSCSKEEMVNHDMEGDWVVLSFEDYQASNSVTKTEENTWKDFNNGDITVNFSFVNKENGIISGKKVTNNFSGNFRTGVDNMLAIDNIMGTEINEPEWGRMFHRVIDAESYEVKGSRLIIYYNNKENGIVLQRP